MSTVVKPKLSASEASKKVAQHLSLEESKRLTDALVIVASELVVRNESVAERLRVVYAALPPAPNARTKKRRSITDFKPIKQVEGLSFDATKPLDPYLLHEAYGDEQLPGILDFLSLARLKDSAGVVELRHPGTKPMNRSQKASVIDYIVAHVMADTK